MKRTLAALATDEDFAQQISLFEIDTDHNFEVASDLNIRSIPSLLVMKEGRIVSKIIGGATPRSLESKLRNLLLT
jgi:thioredoxin-like negative regulator of GroEL